jgi:polyisoprenyl-teichoic acid--peptidoglycan teichoic acid transferase
MKRYGFLFAMAIVTLMIGGIFVYAISVNAAPNAAINNPSNTVQVLISPSATRTATPFQPLPITSTPTQTPIPTATLTPTPIPATLTPTATVPPPIPWDNGIEIPEGQVKIMVMGSDERVGGGYRTDVMILVILNPQQGTVSVLSFPRDLYVMIPGWGMNRLNTAMEFGKFPTMMETLKYNFGFQPDHYILTNFKGFVEIIDSVGGITVNIEKEFSDQCDIPLASYGKCTVRPGPMVMDGQTALWYVRARHTTSDFDRTRRQQEVLKAIFQRMLNADAIFKAPEFYEFYQNNVQTDLSLEDVLPLLKVAPRFAQPEHIRRFAIGPGQVYDFINESGAWVLGLNPPAVKAVVEEALAP